MGQKALERSDGNEVNHVAFYGMGGTGKTYAMKMLAKDLDKRREPIIVFNPLGQKGWPRSAFIVETADQLEAALNDPSKWGAHVFIDEVLILKRQTRWTGRRAHEFLPLMLTTGRHRGFTFYMATVRPFQVPPDWRNNVNECYCFRLAGSRDARSVWDDFDNEELNGKPAHMSMKSLPDRHYIKFTRGQSPGLGRT